MNAPLPSALYDTTYAHSECKIGILHLGFGAFNRDHQALYIDRYMQATNDLLWGIAAVNLRAAEAEQFAQNTVQITAENTVKQPGHLIKAMTTSG